MKPLLRPYAVIAAMAIISVCTGCAANNQKPNSSTQIPTENSTQAATVKPLQTPLEKPSQKLSGKSTELPTELSTEITEEPTVEIPTVIPTEDSSERTKAMLTAQKWILKKCIVNGKEMSPARQYGHFIGKTGAYIQFNNEDTFSCVMGFIFCEGTYEVSGETVDVHITGEADGASTSAEPTDKYQTLDCDFDNGVIKLNYSYGDSAPIIHIFEKA